jgi:TonB family protein
MGAILIQIAPEAGASGHWRMKSKKIDGMKLTALSVKSLKEPNGRVIQGYADYFTSSGALRIRQSFEGVTTYKRFQQFQTLLIPRSIDVTSEREQPLEISIETLEPLDADKGETANITVAPKDLFLVGNDVVVSRAVMAGRIVHLLQPEYPSLAKSQRIQGTVILGMIIDENGGVRDLHVMKSAGQLLDNAALGAVRQWQYKPTILNGVPVAVDTTISVVFSLHLLPLFPPH